MTQITNNVQVIPQLTGSGVGQPGSSEPAVAATQNASGNTASSLATNANKSVKSNSAAVSDAVVQINDYMQYANRSLEFSVDQSTGQTVIKVVDQSTGKVLQQIPPEYAIKLAQTLLDTKQVSSIGIKVTT